MFCTFFYFIAHFTLISPFLTICMPLCYVTLYNLYSYYFALSTEQTWFDYISLLIIPCITIMWQIKKPWFWAISNNDENAYLDEIERLTSWCQDNCLSLNVSKTKELIVDFRKREQRPYTPLMISGTPVERVSSFKYLGVNITKDLTQCGMETAPIRTAKPCRELCA